MADLFEKEPVEDISGADQNRPLADRARPGSLDGFYGQEHLLADGKPLRVAIEQGRAHSMIFWGPPGTGKTTLARMIANTTDAHFIGLSAVMAGIKEVRAAAQEAKEYREVYDKRTVLFLDEVHRFNKSQQDAFLPYVEDGTLTFIGATTENPSFELNNALLSRARVYVLKSLEQTSLAAVLNKALLDPTLGLAADGVRMESEAGELITLAADGDARRAVNTVDRHDWIAGSEIYANIRYFRSRALPSGLAQSVPESGGNLERLVERTCRNVFASNPVGRHAKCSAIHSRRSLSFINFVFFCLYSLCAGN